jgi:hypothetical protein
MTKDEGLKATVREREDATAIVWQFAPRPQHGRHKANKIAADSSAAPKAPASVGDSDDPGPTAA